MEKKENTLMFWRRIAIFGLAITALSQLFQGMAAEWALSIGLLFVLVSTIVGMITDQGFWRMIFITALLLTMGMIVLWSQLQFAKPFEQVGLGVTFITWLWVTISYILSLLTKKKTK